MKTQNQNFVILQNGNFKMYVLPHNIAKTEAALAKVKPPKWGKSEVRQTDAKRHYPMHRPEMTTAEYIAEFWKGNARIYGGQYAENGAKLTAGYSCANYHAAPAQYDPLVPLCVESENPDYDPATDTSAPKAKAPRISKQAARIAELQVALDICIQQMQQAQKLVDCQDFSCAIYAAQMALAGK